MSDPIGRTVPAGVERPKRVAKALADIFPKRKLAECQAATAQVFGFPDWHALEQSIKLGATPGPFDEDLQEGQAVARRTAQMRLIARQLGEVDLDANYPPPQRDPLDHLGTKRLHMAYLRLTQTLASEAIAELTPTTKSHNSADEPLDVLCLCKSEDFSSLPQKLGQWWKVNVPHQPEVGMSLEKRALDVKSGVSILKLASHWGTLCMYYASTIGAGMAMGTAQILAEGYSAAHLSYSSSFLEFAATKGHTEDEREKLLDALVREKAEIEEDFYRCFPRDDFIGVWLAQPLAFLQNAKDVLKILENPSSRKGTWASEAEGESEDRPTPRSR